MIEKLVIGVDGGATKTHLAIANSKGELLALHESGGTYFILEDALVQMVALFKPISGRTIASAAFTVSGWDYETDQQQQRALIEQALAINNVTVDSAIYENDVFSTLKSAKDVTGPAIVISCGTGIIGLAAANGIYYKTPGYEYLSGEWGSGIHQAEYAIHLACASLLGRQDYFPILINTALKYFEASDLETLAYNISNKFVTNRQRGYFLKDVYDAFRQGCPGAARVVERAGDELARTAWCLLKKMDTPGASIIFGGGVIKQFGIPPTFASHLHALTGKSYPLYVVKSLPVYGALTWALNAVSINAAHIEALLLTELIYNE